MVGGESLEERGKNIEERGKRREERKRGERRVLIENL